MGLQHQWHRDPLTWHGFDSRPEALAVAQDIERRHTRIQTALQRVLLNGKTRYYVLYRVVQEVRS